MYKKILVALENGRADDTLVPHIAELARRLGSELLVASQVCLSMQLGFACWPLMRFTGEKAKMGEFVNPLWIKLLGWTTTLLIIGLNVKLLLDIAGVTGGSP